MNHYHQTSATGFTQTGYTLAGQPYRPRLGELRFRYNHAFLPEYVTPIGISIIFSWTFHSQLPAIARNQNPHLPIALLLIVVLILILVLVTLHARFRYGTVRLTDSQLQFWAWAFCRRAIEPADIDHLTEHMGYFYGRRCREVRVWTIDGKYIYFNDFIEKYELLLEELLFRTRVPFQREIIGYDTEVIIRQLQQAAAHRHRVFYSRTGLNAWVNMMTLRVISLVPIMAVDLVIFFGSAYLLARFANPQWCIYASVLALISSALVGRFVYYYAFSSARMNDPDYQLGSDVPKFNNPE